MRETNPYLLLDEEGGGGDDFNSPEVRTELGLLSSSSERPYEDVGGDGVNHNYSLGDEDEELEIGRGAGRKGPPARPKSNID